jgi:hypothetical protein
MREGHYRIKVTILEANDLIPKEEGALDILLLAHKDGMLDPYVSVNVHNQIKKTKKLRKQINPIFN